MNESVIAPACLPAMLGMCIIMTWIIEAAIILWFIWKILRWACEGIESARDRHRTAQVLAGSKKPGPFRPIDLH